MRERTYAVLVRPFPKDMHYHRNSVAHQSYVWQRPDSPNYCVLQRALDKPTEIYMYIGGGILGTILIIALIVYLLRKGLTGAREATGF